MAAGTNNFFMRLTSTFESILLCLLKVEFFIARDNNFCQVSDRYCDVVVCFQAFAAHDSAPAGRFIADIPAYVAGAG
ncbi:MAG: hypothetical protein ABSC01_13810 [Verrucomicrobiota bacterium]|jgi:hypothetical protein